MAVKSPSTIYNELIASKMDIIVQPQEALQIYQIFRNQPKTSQAFKRLEYRAFMQACLMSAVEASDAMGWIEALFRSGMKPNASIKGIIFALVKKGMQKYYGEKTGAPKELYHNVIQTISWSHKSWFVDIEQGLGVMF